MDKQQDGKLLVIISNVNVLNVLIDQKFKIKKDNYLKQGKTLADTSQKKYLNGQEAYERIINNISLQRNTNISPILFPQRAEVSYILFKNIKKVVFYQ